jgi:Uma2 family endonuclease
MKQDTLAPWAESVPDAPFPQTVADLLARADDGWMYELVEGRLVRMPGSGYEASHVAARLLAVLLPYVEDRGLGTATGADGTYDLTQPGDTEQTALVPDVAFVAAGREPARTSPEYSSAPRLAPDLIAEVVSPSQFRPEMEAKARRYLASGVRLVWIIWPKYAQVDVWRPGSNAPVAALSLGDSLDGAEVIPGFTFPLDRLFA